jgi:hypothetical protein
VSLGYALFVFEVKLIRRIMEKVYGILSILSGLLKEFKELFWGRPKLKIKLKDGRFFYYKKVFDKYGNIHSHVTSADEANKLFLYLKFDISNVGNVGTGITDISIELKSRGEQRYYRPIFRFPIENKELNETSFNLEANGVKTIETELRIVKDEDNNYMFENINLDPDNKKNKLRIVVIVENIRGKQVRLHIEPISILTAG